MTLFLDDGDVRLYHGDAVEQLRTLPDGCVDMVATSPPFYGLRDYGVEGQVGLEETPQQWVDNLVAVFRECRRVLADHGTLWVEIGDSYSGAHSGYSVSKAKDLLGQPWMLAFALRADGWYLRSEIIWARPNPMPESVTDRPTKAHSTVFLLSKQTRYFYDADAIREPHMYQRPDAADNAQARQQMRRMEQLKNGAVPRAQPAVGRSKSHATQGDGTSQVFGMDESGANARSVWNIATEPTPFAHFATWPQKLVARMVQAGTSERGRCPECGSSWVRQTERPAGNQPLNTRDIDRTYSPGNTPHKKGDLYDRSNPPVPVTLGWSPSCTCVEDKQAAGGYPYPLPPVPCVVLDPFAGSGTTLLVARNHQRHAIGIELNADYCAIAADRLSQLSLLTGDAA